MKFVISSLTPPSKFRPKGHREVSRRMKLLITTIITYRQNWRSASYLFGELRIGVNITKNHNHANSVYCVEGFVWVPMLILRGVILPLQQYVV